MEKKQVYGFNYSGEVINRTVSKGEINIPRRNSYKMNR